MEPAGVSALFDNRQYLRDDIIERPRHVQMDRARQFRWLDESGAEGWPEGKPGVRYHLWIVRAGGESCLHRRLIRLADEHAERRIRPFR